jgi:hypothetical protein
MRKRIILIVIIALVWPVAILILQSRNQRITLSQTTKCNSSNSDGGDEGDGVVSLSLEDQQHRPSSVEAFNVRVTIRADHVPSGTAPAHAFQLLVSNGHEVPGTRMVMTEDSEQRDMVRYLVDVMPEIISASDGGDGNSVETTTTSATVVIAVVFVESTSSDDLHQQHHALLVVPFSAPSAVWETETSGNNSDGNATTKKGKYFFHIGRQDGEQIQPFCSDIVSHVFNPSAAAQWSSLTSPLAPLQLGGTAIVAYRGVGPNSSVVLLRERPLPTAQQDGREGELRLPAWNNSDGGEIVIGVNAVEDQSGTRCPTPHPLGFEDPRAMTLLVTTNAMHPEDCHRGIVLFEFDVPTLLASLRRNHSSSASSSASQAPSRTVTVMPQGVHFLKLARGWSGSKDGMDGWEKNWMPFIHNATMLLFLRRIEPHEVVRCDVAGDGQCEVFASAGCPRLAQMLDVGGDGSDMDLRCNTGVVDRGADFLGCGHVKQAGWRYTFFWFTFSKAPPFEVTGLSRLFRVVDPAPAVQYISGVVLVGEWYLVTLSLADATSDSLWFRRAEIDTAIVPINRSMCDP